MQSTWRNHFQLSSPALDLPFRISFLDSILLAGVDHARDANILC